MRLPSVASVAYNIYKPFWKFNNLYTNFSTSYSRLYRPDTFQNFWMNAGVLYYPEELL
jgi:hypothetical protein